MIKENELIKKEVDGVVEKANKFVIKTQSDYDKVNEFLIGVKGLIKKVKASYDPICEAANAAWKTAVAQRKEQLDPLEAAEKIVKQRSIEFLEEQDRIRREAEAKAQREAEAAEAKRRAELEAQAKAHEAKGNTAKAEERRQMAEQVAIAPKPVAPTVQKASNQALKDVWNAEVTDLNALVKAVAEGRAPINLIKADEVVIRGIATKMQGNFPIPGIRFFSTKQLAVRT